MLMPLENAWKILALRLNISTKMTTTSVLIALFHARLAREERLVNA